MIIYNLFLFIFIFSIITINYDYTATLCLYCRISHVCHGEYECE